MPLARKVAWSWSAARSQGTSAERQEATIALTESLSWDINTGSGPEAEEAEEDAEEALFPPLLGWEVADRPCVAVAMLIALQMSGAAMQSRYVSMEDAISLLTSERTEPRSGCGVWSLEERLVAAKGMEGRDGGGCEMAGSDGSARSATFKVNFLVEERLDGGAGGAAAMPRPGEAATAAMGLE